MRIRVIVPVTNPSVEPATLEVYTAKARKDTLISVARLQKGPSSIECLYDDAAAAPQVVEIAIAAERDGVHAVIIDCMNDPALEAAREAVRIPVIGAAQSAMLMASLLAHRFSIIGTAARDEYPNERLVHRYGLTRKYASTRSVNIPVPELASDQNRLLNVLVEQSLLAIRQDGAHAIIFGCTGMKGMASRVEKRLREQGIDIIVIDPSQAALKWAELLVGLHLAHSRITYPPVVEKLLQEHRHDFLYSYREIAGKLENKSHLHVLVPVTQGHRGGDWLEEGRRAYAGYARTETRLSMTPIQAGPATIETQYDKAMAVPDMLRLIRLAEKEKATAAIIDCMSDPGLDPMREIASIPVIGPAQTCAFVAASLGHSFSILGTLSAMGHKFAIQMEEYGISSKLASVRTTGLSVQKVESDPASLIKALIREALHAVDQDGAHVLIPGCTGMIGIAAKLQHALEKRGILIPVLEPAAVSVRVAEALNDLDLSHSKITYPNPPQKEMPGYPDLEIQKG